jgi:hypothetical protein
VRFEAVTARIIKVAVFCPEDEGGSFSEAFQPRRQIIRPYISADDILRDDNMFRTE